MTMNRFACVTLCLLSFGFAEPDVGNGTRLSGTLTFTCTPDEKSKKAGATPFEDTLELGNDRVKSKVLSADGFPVALSIPKMVNGVPTFNAAFKKPGATATYFIRVKDGGTVSGSLTRTQGGKTTRYTIGTAGGGGGRDGAKGQDGAPGRGTADPALDPAVLRVNGGFVRLMSVQVAMADAGVNADKAKIAAVVKAAGGEQNKLRGELLRRKITPEQYAKQAELRLNEARQNVAQLLGDRAAKVESAYDAPFAGAYVYLNQMRAAATEANTSEGGDDAGKRADQAIYKSLIELTTLAKKREALTPEAVEKMKDRTRSEVIAALGEAQRERFEKTLTGLASYDSGSATTKATTTPAKATPR